MTISIKKWIKHTILLTVVGLLLVALPTVIIDPYFHYHKPLPGISYLMAFNTERYLNDGIVRHFDYDAIITGTSMSENFKTSEMDALYGTNAVKVTFAGATFKEIHDNLERAYEANDGIKVVISDLMGDYFLRDKDEWTEMNNRPTYLANDNLLDDVNYVLNYEILKQSLFMVSYTLQGGQTTDFDTYMNWSYMYPYDGQGLFITYQYNENPPEEDRHLTEEERQIILENIEANILSITRAHPETTFYYYLPPYSVCYWDWLDSSKEVSYFCETLEVGIEALLGEENIRLYGYDDLFEVTGNLNIYRDLCHYNGDMNSALLTLMKEGTGLLTEENYQNYINTIEEYYLNYDYTELRAMKAAVDASFSEE